ncbi:MAG: DUF429 domain-containing protein [Oscillospiraceae bacterium]|jgi:predicted RNase H-like nuclease|nr:DUF429 domain-containing protein [Oscillospiraceae bacterium]
MSITPKTAHALFPTKPFLSVGIDGCEDKWVAVAIKDSGFEVELYKSVAEICEKYQSAKSPENSIIIDMPIGLPDRAEDLRPDVLLRSKLKGRASTVFPVLGRKIVNATDYEQAKLLNKELTGKTVVKQSFDIFYKIREIDDFLRDNPEWKNRLVESHPEYCFALLNDNKPILGDKKKAGGECEIARIETLSKYYPEITLVIEEFRNLFNKRMKPENRYNDLLDALALAIVGAIGLRHGFTYLPEIPTADSQGLLMQIVGANIPQL